jgi:hypothetical protein
MGKRFTPDSEMCHFYPLFAPPKETAGFRAGARPFRRLPPAVGEEITDKSANEMLLGGPGIINAVRRLCYVRRG